MKVLVLGADGMLGSALVDEFADQEVIVGCQPDYEFTKPEQLSEKIKADNPNVVINAAAFTAVDDCEAVPETCNLINGQSVGQLAKITNNLNISLVHISTDYVFDGKKVKGYRESDQPNPINAYGRSKFLGEKLLQKNTDNFYLIRTAWLFGPRGSNFIETIKEKGNKFKELKVVEDQFGCPTYTRDLAKAIKKLLFNKTKTGVYHLTNNGSCSWYQLADKVKDLARLAVKIKPVATSEYPTTAQRPKSAILLNTKLPLLRPWQEALEEYIELS